MRFKQGKKALHRQKTSTRLQKPFFCLQIQALHFYFLGVSKPQYAYPLVHAITHESADAYTAAWSGYPFVVGS